MNFLIKGRVVTITETKLSVDLTDGRTIIVPLSWFPRLVEGTPEERAHWRWIAQGMGIHWPDLDEDISVAHLLEGKPSGESETSLQRWREARPPHKNEVDLREGLTRRVQTAKPAGRGDNVDN